jgi:hypothetical protein
MQSLSLSHPHIVRTFQFHSCIRKERIPWKTPRRHALRSHSLRWHYPNQVRSKIYLPLSLSHKLPLALFFSVFQYSTHLSRCQTSTAYCSLHSRRRLSCMIYIFCNCFYHTSPALISQDGSYSSCVLQKLLPVFRRPALSILHWLLQELHSPAEPLYWLPEDRHY